MSAHLAQCSNAVRTSNAASAGRRCRVLVQRTSAPRHRALEIGHHVNSPPIPKAHAVSVFSAERALRRPSSRLHPGGRAVPRFFAPNRLRGRRLNVLAALGHSGIADVRGSVGRRELFGWLAPAVIVLLSTNQGNAVLRDGPNPATQPHDTLVVSRWLMFTHRTPSPPDRWLVVIVVVEFLAYQRDLTLIDHLLNLRVVDLCGVVHK